MEISRVSFRRVFEEQISHKRFVDLFQAAVNAVELQQTVEALKAQIERLRAHCAALEAKAGGDAADRVPKQSDGRCLSSLFLKEWSFSDGRNV